MLSPQPMIAGPFVIASGAIVDGYRVLGPLGRGAMSLVFKAEHIASGRMVALKTLRTWAGADTTQAARFEREARAADGLRHAAIVPVLDVGSLKDGRPYLVLPLLSGQTLAEAIETRGPLSPAAAWQILRPIAEALGEAHSQGTLHRDVKPSNIFLERGGEDGSAKAPNNEGRELPRLLDFGLARPVTGPEIEEATKLTQTGELIGTPLYLSPEQCWGLEPTPHVDQYAFGVTLFETLTGRPPFDGTSFAALVQKHLHDTPPTLASCGVVTAKEVESAVAKLLHKEPNQRFASMADVVDVFDAALGIQSNSQSTAPLPVKAAFLSPEHKYLVWHFSILFLGFMALLTMGYAGTAQYNPFEWLKIGGYSQSATVLGFFAAAIFFWRKSVKKDFAIGTFGGKTGHQDRIQSHSNVSAENPRIGMFVLALMPAVTGALGTYPNWRAVERTLASTSGLSAFQIFCEGTYEANAARFVGYAFASILCVSLAALPLARRASKGATSGVVSRIEQRVSAASVLGLIVLAVSAALLGAPSGTFVAGIAAACLALPLVFRTNTSELSATDQVLRAAASVLSVVLAFAVGIARVEARKAALWFEPKNRAERVLEILNAHAEMNATLQIGLAALVTTLAVFAFVLSQTLRTKPFPKLPRAAWAMVVACLLVASVDVTIRQQFLTRREELRKELVPQFTTFVRLNPPAADSLDPQTFAPRKSTALQIAKDVVAINGRGVAKLSALDTEAGTFHFTAALQQALAQAAIERGSDEVDLAVTADEGVSFGVIVRLLGIARGGGARFVDLVFRRGAKPLLAAGGPPEAAYVVPSDFVVVPIEMKDAGFQASPEQPWGDVASYFIARADISKPLAVVAKAK